MNTNFMEMLKDAMELGLTKEEAMSFVKDCLALTNTPTTVGGNPPKKGTSAKAPKKTEEKKTEEKPKKEYDIEDVKFEKYNDGNCNWDYYKEVRKSYCYRRQGCKVWNGKVTKPKGFTFDKDKWEEDKKVFNAKFPYIKKSDRK